MKTGATLLHMLTMLGIACLLGVLFNNANPIALRAPEAQTAVANAISPHTPSDLQAQDAPSNSTPAVVAESLPIISISWAEAREQLADGKSVLVDARITSFYQAGHILNAVSLPINASADEFAGFKSSHPAPATPLIVYCGGEHCHLSHDLATVLTTQHGYTNVKVLRGGYDEYLREEVNNKSAEVK